MISNLRSSEWLLKMRALQRQLQVFTEMTERRFFLVFLRSTSQYYTCQLFLSQISEISPCHDRDFRKRPGDFRRFPKTSERCRKLNVRYLFPKTFEHFWSYLKDDTFSVLWYDFVRTQKKTQSHHVLRTICPDLWVRRDKLSLMREIDVFSPQVWLDWRIMRIQYSDGINFDWLKGWQCWTLASKNVRVEKSNTRLEKRRATRNAYNSKTDENYGILASVFKFNV